MKRIAVLGSTGSIGRNTLEVVRNLNRNGYPVSVDYLTANSNTRLLLEQIHEFKPKAISINDKGAFDEIKSDAVLNRSRLFCGKQGLLEITGNGDYDLLVNALVGFAGLLPTIEALKRQKDVALANKESLVIAGELIYGLLRNSSSNLIPIDSEHSAILQCIRGESLNRVTKITLTASGGPFLNFTRDELGGVTVEQALKHPNWKMGKKITIDSATLMNKGFEIIEGRWLFDVETENIDVVIHPQSIIHSFVEFADGSVKAQLGVPDMRIPIQYSITYPDRVVSDFPRLELGKLKDLTFSKPDFDKFECLKLAYDVMKLGGTYPVVLNASNEAAVDLFLKKKIKFPDIASLIKSALDEHDSNREIELDNIVEIDRQVREFVRSAAVL